MAINKLMIVNYRVSRMGCTPADSELRLPDGSDVAKRSRIHRDFANGPRELEDTDALQVRISIA
jgi:hypothetical protein